MRSNWYENANGLYFLHSMESYGIGFIPFTAIISQHVTDTIKLINTRDYHMRKLKILLKYPMLPPMEVS